MGLEGRLAWRNIWRNPRRTVLTVAATVFALVLVVFFESMRTGMHEKWIEDSVRVHSGHVVLAGEGYLVNRTLEQFVRLDEALEARLDRLPDVSGWAPRVVSFGLLGSDAPGSPTRGVGVLGVDPERESSVTTLAKRVKSGAFIRPGATREIVLGTRLAEALDVELGDELLLYSFAYSLETAYDLFRVVGVMRLPEPELDRTLAVISLADAQQFFVYGDRVSEVAILASGADRTGPLRDRLASALPSEPPAEVYTWREAMPELEQILFLDALGMYILLIILVVVVAFGILNTILMAVLERQKEFGVCLALGLRPRAIFRIVYLESLMLAAVGLAIGLPLAIGLVLWLQAHPILLTGEVAQAIEFLGVEPQVKWKFEVLNPIAATLVITGVAILAAVYPSFQASRGRPVDVLRSL